MGLRVLSLLRLGLFREVLGLKGFSVGFRSVVGFRGIRFKSSR